MAGLAAGARLQRLPGARQREVVLAARSQEFSLLQPAAPQHALRICAPAAAVGCRKAQKTFCLSADGAAHTQQHTQH